MDPEPISPELVLVAPPELAALAREQLPDPSIPFWIAIRGDERPEPPPYRWCAHEDEPVPRAPKRWSARRALAVAAGIVVVAATLLFATTGADHRSGAPHRSLAAGPSALGLTRPPSARPPRPVPAWSPSPAVPAART